MTCPRVTRRIKPAIAAFNNGSDPGDSIVSSNGWPKTSATAAASISVKPSSMPPSPGRKKGARRWAYSPR